MKKVLTICPSRGRIKKAKIMYESFLFTYKMSDLVLCLDFDDPQIELYKKSFHGLPKCVCSLFEHSNITILFNNILKLFPNYDYYHLTNDDFIYKTQAWDEILINQIERHGGWGVAYGNDLLAGASCPTAPMISGNLARLLGWLQMPKLTHLYGDMVWKIIGHKIDRLFFMPEVIIQHCHPLDKKTPEDDIFRYTNSQEMYEKDCSALRDWVCNDMDEQVRKIKEAMNV